MGAETKSMEIKKSHQFASEKNFSAKKVQTFIADVKGEVKKITWTTRDELILYTKLVVGATFVFGMSIYGLDLLIQGVLGSLNYFLQLISG